MGADAILLKHLSFLLVTETSTAHESMASAESPMLEMSMALDALECVYRASSATVGKSFDKVGLQLVDILVKCLDEELDRRISRNLVKLSSNVGLQDNVDVKDEAEGNATGTDVKIKEEEGVSGSEDSKLSGVDDPNEAEVEAEYIASPEEDTIILKTTRILGHLARVGGATKALAHFPGLLGTLLKLITLYPYQRIPWEARLSALWTIANLGCNSENMQLMVSTPGLIDALVHVSCRNLHPGDSVETTMDILRGRSIASRCLLNLSWSPQNKIILGQQSSLIDLLTELAVHRHAPLSNSRTVKEILTKTRQHAVGALRNLAAAPRRSKILLCSYRNGHVLGILTDAALNDNDQAVKDRSFAAINNLAIHDTAEQIVNHPALVMALKDVLLSAEEEERQSNVPSDNKEGTPRAHAAATLMVLERTITPDMPSYQNLRDLLDALNPSSPSGDEEGEDGESLHATAV